MMMMTTTTKRNNNLILILYIIFTILSIINAETEVKWTPSDDSQEQLPLSMNQRQQLLKLEQSIMNSPDPTATLQQVATNNNMDPQELINMLQRNRADLEASGALTAGTTGSPTNIPKNIINAITGSIVALIHASVRHPKMASFTFLTCLCMTYIIIQKPRTGLVISNYRKTLLSNGPTTLFIPPNDYIYKQLEYYNQYNNNNNDDEKTYTDLWKHLKIKKNLNDGITWHDVKTKTKYKNLFRQAVSFQTTITTFEKEEDDDENTNDYNEIYNNIEQWSLDHTVRVLRKRDFLEWIDEWKILSDNNDFSIVMIPGIGDYKRYGLVPFKVIYENYNNDDEYRIVLNTIKGIAHFDGEIDITIIHQDRNTLSVRVTLLIPTKGKVPNNKKLLEQIIQNISYSISTSIQTRTKQSLVRALQSNRYSKSIKEKFQQRRHTRDEKERKIEEMATDRRRRWQRNNPNSGYYRPSGDRMRSPNNAIYH